MKEVTLQELTETEIVQAEQLNSLLGGCGAIIVCGQNSSEPRPAK